MKAYDELIKVIVEKANEELHKEGMEVVLRELENVPSANFGLLVREYRKKNKILQSELAHRTGISESTIIAVEKEHRNITYETMKKIVEGLGAELLFYLKKKQ